MALIKPLPSEQARVALAESLIKYGRPDDPLLLLMIHAPVQRIYTLKLQDLKQGGAGMAAALEAGWRFVASADSQAAAAEVSEPVQGKAPKMRSVTRGRQAEAAHRALQEVEELPQAGAFDSELRMLRIPGLLIEALWLKPQGAGEELVYPYLTPIRQLQSKRAYSVGEFLSIVAPLAGQVLESSDAPPSLQH